MSPLLASYCCRHRGRVIQRRREKPATHKPRRETWNRSFFRGLQKESTLPTPGRLDFGLFPSQMVADNFQCVKPPSVWCLCMAALGPSSRIWSIAFCSVASLADCWQSPLPGIVPMPQWVAGEGHQASLEEQEPHLPTIEEPEASGTGVVAAETARPVVTVT